MARRSAANMTVVEIQLALVKYLKRQGVPVGLDRARQDIGRQSGKTIFIRDWRDAIASEVQAGRISNKNSRLKFLGTKR